ncbi:MAG: hypothetical protein R6U29_04975 [Desulfosudaceae bacterium]
MNDHHHHDQHTSHHHEHHEPGQGMSFQEKISKLLDHWIAHNESHAQTYLEWRQKAEAEGFTEIAALLGSIAETSDRITEKLRHGRHLTGQD